MSSLLLEKRVSEYFFVNVSYEMFLLVQLSPEKLSLNEYKRKHIFEVEMIIFETASFDHMLTIV